jgi:hypothetical protein
MTFSFGERGRLHFVHWHHCVAPWLSALAEIRLSLLAKEAACTLCIGTTAWRHGFQHLLKSGFLF